MDKADVTLEALVKDQHRQQTVLNETQRREDRELLEFYVQAYPEAQLTPTEREILDGAGRAGQAATAAVLNFARHSV